MSTEKCVRVCCMCSAGKGLGVFASRPFAAGETVFTDSALASYPALLSPASTSAALQFASQLWPAEQLQCAYCLRFHTPTAQIAPNQTLTSAQASALYRSHLQATAQRSMTAACTCASDSATQRLQVLERAYPLPIPSALLQVQAKGPVLGPVALAVLQHYGLVRLLSSFSHAVCLQLSHFRSSIAAFVCLDAAASTPSPFHSFALLLSARPHHTSGHRARHRLTPAMAQRSTAA